MAQSFDLYVDTYSRKSVTSDTDATPAPLPIFTQGDTFTLRVYLLARTKNFPLGDNSDPSNKKPPYLIINNTGLTLKVALGMKNCLDGHAIYTQQFTWTPDAGNNYFAASFPMNPQAVCDLLASAATASAWFEIKFYENLLPWTVLQENVTINASVIGVGDLVPVQPGQTALSAEDARIQFLGRKISGPIYLEDVNNAGQFLAVYNQDGSLKVDNVGTLP